MKEYCWPFARVGPLQEENSGQRKWALRAEVVLIGQVNWGAEENGQPQVQGSKCSQMNSAL